jgi:hypothetical protein
LETFLFISRGCKNQKGRKLALFVWHCKKLEENWKQGSKTSTRQISRLPLKRFSTNFIYLLVVFELSRIEKAEVFAPRFAFPFANLTPSLDEIKICLVKTDEKATPSSGCRPPLAVFCEPMLIFLPFSEQKKKRRKLDKSNIYLLEAALQSKPKKKKVEEKEM